MSKYIIGIDLGGTSIKMGLTKPNGEIIKKWDIPTNISDRGSLIVPNIIDSISSTLNELSIDSSELLGIGMGSPGSVNPTEGTVIGAYNLNWTELQPVKEQFQRAFDMPFIIDNDANVAALGEQWIGAGDQDSHIVMVTLGTGVGGGIVIDGKLFHGSVGSAGEIGHITVDPHSPIRCTCGKVGCLEALASATGIVNLAHHYLQSSTLNTHVREIIEQGKELTAKDIFVLAQEGDLFAIEITDLFSQYLGLACGHIANILNPSKIILGGGVAQAGEYLRNRVEEYMTEYTFPPIRETVELNLATLGNDAGIYGAARLVINDVER